MKTDISNVISIIRQFFCGFVLVFGGTWVLLIFLSPFTRLSSGWGILFVFALMSILASIVVSFSVKSSNGSLLLSLLFSFLFMGIYASIVYLKYNNFVPT